MSRRDGHTRDLFAAPPVPANLPGSRDYRAVVAGLVAELLRHAATHGADRYEVAARMSRLLGRDVSKYMLDAWTAESREDHNLPFAYLVALEEACETHLLSTWLAETRGGRLFIGRDALDAELGLIEHQRNELNDRIRAMRDLLRKGG